MRFLEILDAELYTNIADTPGYLMVWLETASAMTCALRVLTYKPHGIDFIFLFATTGLLLGVGRKTSARMERHFVHAAWQFMPADRIFESVFQ